LRVAIIDGDSMIWVAAYHAQTIGIGAAIADLDNHIIDMLTKIEATHYHGYIGGGSASRKAISSLYKSTRPTRPEFYTDYSRFIIEHLLDKWKFEQVNQDIETDDICAIAAEHYEKQGDDYIICSQDKDLNQIKGNHYNPKKDEAYFLTEDEALHYWYTQLLTGDSTDNVKGLEGCGPVGAKKILADGAKAISILLAYTNKYGQKQGLMKFAESIILLSLGREKLDINSPQEFKIVKQEAE
jgi:DNA polymerase I